MSEFKFVFDFEVVSRVDLPKGSPKTFCVTYKIEEVWDAGWVPQQEGGQDYVLV